MIIFITFMIGFCIGMIISVDVHRGLNHSTWDIVKDGLMCGAFSVILGVMASY